MSKMFSRWFLGGCFFSLFHLYSYSQDRPLGTWKVFMPFGSCVGLCDAGNKVYSAAGKSVFSYEKETGVIQIYDKNTGLSDIDVRTINYDPEANVLVIAYSNSNIDLIYNGTDIYNISDIKNGITTGAININGISFYNGNAYISSDVGISVVNLEKREISNTYVIGSSGGQVKVYSTSVDGVNIYAATEEGVKHAPLSSANLQNFANWTTFDSTENLPKRKAVFVECFSNKVYAVIAGNGSDTLYEFNGTLWAKKFFSTKNTITSLRKVNNTLYFSVWNDDSTTAGKKGKIDADEIFSIEPVSGHVRPIEWFESGGISWEGDSWNGLFKNNNQGGVENIIPDGPFQSSVFDIEVSDGVVKVAAGGVNDSWIGTGSNAGFYIYKNNRWTSRNMYSDASLDGFTDVLAVASAASRGKTYFGTFSSGLIELDDNSDALKLYDKWSSDALLEGVPGDSSRTKISCLTTDKDGNVWMANWGTKPIKAIMANGTWKEFSVPHSFQVIKKILIDRNGQLWAPVRRTGEGLLVWSANGTIDNPNDDISKLLTTGEGMGGLPDTYVFCLEEDKEGSIWIGTGKGIGVFYCPGSVLTQNGCDADQIKVERDGYIGYLFGTESVRAIAVDAANRKWIGTTNGLWLISADGKKELLKFTVDNSPLPANQITDIAIDEQTGEVFIGTISGLVSYQGDAIANCDDCDEALVYPNPVKPDYNGPIAIKGLTDDAYVKITDISGTLVFQGRANGSQMIWDGKGYNSVRVRSGVYLVFSSTDLGKEKRVAKILIAN